MRTIKILAAAAILTACAGAPERPTTGPAQTSTAPSGATQPANGPALLTDARPPALQAPLFNGLGDYSRAVSTEVELARRFFNQGMVLTYGFNHAEAGRSFAEALRLDPRCAACAWGAALVLGPNINLPMMEADVPKAWELSRKALELAPEASPVERALIDALAKRYAPQHSADRSALDRAYADAMREVALQFPQDPDVQALFAESLLDLNPWNYWLPDGKPRETTTEATAALERALAVDPKHPGALHYTIHALEEFRPERAVAAADALRDLVPDAGHLVHMPSHIYIRVGRYEDAVAVNLAAGEADTSYIAQCQVQGFYPLLYHPHNWHFVWAAATFAGNREKALLGAERTQHLMHGQSYVDPMAGPIIQHFTLTPLYAATRFGMWDRVLEMKAPGEDVPYLRAMHHYARGLALAARGDVDGAQREHAQLRKLAGHADLPKTMVSVRNNAQQLVAIAERVLAGEIALRSKRYDAAIAALRGGVEREDALGYNEPEDWHYPVRLLLGAALLEAGRPKEAEKAFSEDLAKHPENGWALFGLAQSLEAQERKDEAAAVRARFEKAWSYADTTLTAAVVR